MLFYRNFLDIVDLFHFVSYIRIITGMLFPYECDNVLLFNINYIL